MVSYRGNVNRMSNAELRVDPSTMPGWQTGAERSPIVGERVYCTGGMAEVVRILGKTGDRSRLLELKLDDLKAKPFFAAASNVLVPPSDQD